jgi:hypothetical protein
MLDVQTRLRAASTKAHGLADHDAYRPMSWIQHFRKSVAYVSGRVLGQPCTSMKYIYREKLRQQKFDEQNGRCWLCGLPMTMKRALRGDNGGPQFATFDHIKPQSKGGTWHASNLKLAHQRCNSGRGNQDADKFWLLAE